MKPWWRGTEAEGAVVAGAGVMVGMLIMWGMQEVPPVVDVDATCAAVIEDEPSEKVEAVCTTDTDCEEWEWRQAQERKWREAQQQKGTQMREEVEI